MPASDGVNRLSPMRSRMVGSGSHAPRADLTDGSPRWRNRTETCRRVGVCRLAHADGPDLSATQNEETPGAAGGLFRPIESKSSYCFAGGAGGVGAGFIDGASAGAPA